MQTMLGHGTTTTLAADRYTRRTWWWVALSLLLALAAVPASAIQINPFDTQEDEEPLDPSGVVENLRGKNFDKAVAGANQTSDGQISRAAPDAQTFRPGH